MAIKNSLPADSDEVNEASSINERESKRGYASYAHSDSPRHSLTHTHNHSSTHTLTIAFDLISASI